MANIKRDTAAELEPGQVENYLRQHPDFLDQRPQLLSSLSLSHETPAGVSSLLERQVAILRSDSQRFQGELRALHDDNEAVRALTEQAHQVSLDILRAADPAAVSDLLRTFIHDDYRADDATLFLFLQETPFTATDLIEFRGRHDKLRLLLAELFNRRKPLIDSLQTEHLNLMFGNAAAAVHSSILLPVIGESWDGLLVVGSRQYDHFRRGPELELLVYLLRLTAYWLDHWLETRD